MATTKEVIVKEEELCCYICLELYDKPRTLPCLHSFCHLCLVRYVKPHTKSVVCPICRSETKLDKFIGNAEKWVGSLPVNFTLVSILGDKTRKMSGARKNCEQCQRENLETIATVYCYECAEKLCDNCREVHKKVKFLSTHQICDIRNSQENVEKLELLKSLTRCPEHLSEEVRYLCKEHDQLCCNECAIVTHRKCSEMVSVAKETAKTGGSLQAPSARLTQLSEYLKELNMYETKHEASITMCKQEMLNKLKNLKTRFDNAFLAMEQAVTGRFEEKSRSILKDCAIHRQEIESLETEVKFSKTKMAIAEELGQPVHVYLIERILKNEIQQHEDSIRQLHEKMSRRIVRATEHAVCNEIEQKLALCICVEKETSQVNIPQCPGILKYRSWLEAVKSKGDVSEGIQSENYEENEVEHWFEVAEEEEDDEQDNESKREDDNFDITEEYIDQLDELGDEPKHFVPIERPRKNRRKNRKY